MPDHRCDITPFLTQDEGQHFDRKSMYAAAPGAKDQGEGIPRMFAEMEDAFLPRPDVEVQGQQVMVTLRNTSTLTASDRRFVAGVGPWRRRRVVACSQA